MIKKLPKTVITPICFFILAFLVFGHSVSFAQKGIVVNGAYIVIANASGSAPYIFVKDMTSGSGTLSTDCDFTNQSDGNGNLGVVKPVGTGGTISIEGDWNNKCNNGVFSSDGITVALNGTNIEDIGPASGSGGSTTKFYNLTLGGTGLKSLQIDTWVGGLSTLTGVLDIASRTLDLNSHTLTVRNPAAGGIVRSSGMILSETNSANNPSVIKWEMDVNMGAHVYPFGVAGDYIPFTFDKISNSSSTISVSTRATAASNNLPWETSVTKMERNGIDGSVDYVIDRWWEVSSSLNPLTGGGANLTFAYRGSENTITSNPTGAIAAQHWDASTSNWEAKVPNGSGVTAGIGYLTTTIAQTKFSPFILVADDNPLPVELLNFSANCNGNNTSLSWATTSESNNHSYTIEKTYNGVDYEELTTVDAKGSYANVNKYEVSDGNTLSGNCYYRLRQTDFNGNSRLLGIINSNCGPKDFEILNVFNKNNNELNLNFRIEDEEAFNFEIYNAIGQKMISFPYKSLKGINEVSFDVTNFTYGVYFLLMKNDRHSFSRKVIVKK